jgi:hypothetical protein
MRVRSIEKIGMSEIGMIFAAPLSALGRLCRVHG